MIIEHALEELAAAECTLAIGRLARGGNDFAGGDEQPRCAAANFDGIDEPRWKGRLT